MVHHIRPNLRTLPGLGLGKLDRKRWLVFKQRLPAGRCSSLRGQDAKGSEHEGSWRKRRING